VINSFKIKAAIWLSFLSLIYSPMAKAKPTLSNWNEPWKSKIENYISRVTKPGSKDFVPIEQRIAAFDLDGTIITERPDYFHGFISKQFLLQKLSKNPSLLENPIYKAVKENQKPFLRKHLKEWLVESFAGESLENLYTFANKIFTEVSPDKNGKPYSKRWYLPMVELIEYLKAAKFKVYIVTTAQQEVVRAVLIKHLKIDAARIMGSMVSYKGGKRGKSVANMVRIKEVWKPICHGRGKVLRFRERVGKPPIFGFGNSTNDIALLYYASTSKWPKMNMVLNHDDPREYIYSKPKLLKIAKKEKWTIVNMKTAFKKVYGNIDFVKHEVHYTQSSKKPDSLEKGNRNPFLLVASILGIIFILGGAVVLIRHRRK
jgi:phosphoserine phosphatase